MAAACWLVARQALLLWLPDGGASLFVAALVLSACTAWLLRDASRVRPSAYLAVMLSSALLPVAAPVLVEQYPALALHPLVRARLDDDTGPRIHPLLAVRVHLPAGWRFVHPAATAQPRDDVILLAHPDLDLNAAITGEVPSGVQPPPAWAVAGVAGLRAGTRCGYSGNKSICSRRNERVGARGRRFGEQEVNVVVQGRPHRWPEAVLELDRLLDAVLPADGSLAPFSGDLDVLGITLHVPPTGWLRIQRPRPDLVLWTGVAVLLHGESETVVAIAAGAAPAPGEPVDLARVHLSESGLAPPASDGYGNVSINERKTSFGTVWSAEVRRTPLPGGRRFSYRDTALWFTVPGKSGPLTLVSHGTSAWSDDGQFTGNRGVDLMATAGPSR
ncbi:MAG: hypothetical protein HY904_09090 [Deltaproteobacteria bacterium]|nr:hypothetical protein [Deltaproteobacteria bacterium]